MKILIADDDGITCNILQAYLEKEQHDVIVVRDGVSAWAEIDRPNPPEIAILDWMMPGITGIELCNRIRTKGESPYIYIIIMTSRSENQDLIVGMFSGADDYLVKPINLAVLGARLNAGIRVLNLQDELLSALKRRDRVELQLQEAMDQMKAVLNAVPGFVSWISDDLHYLGVNQMMADYFGKSAEWFIGKPVGFMGTSTRFYDFAKEFFRKNERRKQEILEMQYNDQSRYHLIAAQKYSDDKNAVYVGIDVTDRIIAEKALQEARRNEVRVAARIQSMLLMSRPLDNIKEFEISNFSIPSQVVDGDFIEYFQPNPEQLDVIIGDVMGKGIPAALIGAAVKHQLLKAQRNQDHHSSDSGIRRISDIILDVDKNTSAKLIEIDSFITMFYIRFDNEARTLTYCNCGHPPAIHFKAATQSCELLSSQNMPIGFVECRRYEETSLALDVGDMILIYSDGISEAKNLDKQLFGENRLIQILTEFNTRPVTEILQRIIEDIWEFSGSDVVSDDLSCFVLRVRSREEISLDTPECSMFPARFEQLSVMREAIRAFFTNENLDVLYSDACVRFELAMNEAAANIIEHALHQDSKRSFGMELYYRNSRISGWLRYAGVAYSPGMIEPVEASADKDGGFGLFIIDRFSDFVTYGTGADGRQFISIAINVE